MHERYIEVLFDQVRDVEYPSVEILDRIEGSITKREQLEEYLTLLLERVESSKYPSKGLLDRLERLSPLLGEGDEESGAARDASDGARSGASGTQASRRAPSRD